MEDEQCDSKDNDCNGMVDDLCGSRSSRMACVRTKGDGRQGPVQCLPNGSYLDTCTNCRVSGGTLTCDCCDGPNCQNQKRSSIPTSCSGGPYQSGGCLTCPGETPPCSPGCDHTGGREEPCL